MQEPAESQVAHVFAPVQCTIAHKVHEHSKLSKTLNPLQGMDPPVAPVQNESDKVAALHQLLASHVPGEAAGEDMSATQLRDRLIAHDPGNAAFIALINQVSHMRGLTQPQMSYDVWLLACHEEQCLRQLCRAETLRDTCILPRLL